MKEYRIADAREPIEQDAAVAAVDLAWARPKRDGVHVTYPTYAPDNGLWEFVDAVYESLTPGGWAFFDADDWLLPRLIQYLQETWGDVASAYNGGGYRRTGTVVYDGHAYGGSYFVNGGYHVVFAHKGETDRNSYESAKQVAKQPSDYGWGTSKPTKPYRVWIESVIDPGELLYVPCAGTAPAAIAAEQIGEIDYLCIDSEPEAKEAFERRKQAKVSYQKTL